MSQPLTRPFASEHSQVVRGPDGRLWQITIQRGNAWQPSRWFEDFSGIVHTGQDSVAGMVVSLLIPPLLAAPQRIGHWAAYRLRRRTDWRVTVQPGAQLTGGRRGAVLDEVHEHKAAAAARAEELRGSYQAGAVPDS
jgi:hypothetical protein